ncbi:hypothetical protein H7U34_01790 [Collinsella tanakaei]|nr:hypothetical protein [Collinsella tanakaei]
MNNMKPDVQESIHKQYAKEKVAPRVEAQLNEALEQYPMVAPMLVDNPLGNNNDINMLGSSNTQICGYFSDDEEIKAGAVFHTAIARKASKLGDESTDGKFYNKLDKLLEQYFSEAVEGVLESKFDDYSEFKKEKLAESRKRGPRKKQE